MVGVVAHVEIHMGRDAEFAALRVEIDPATRLMG